MSFSPFKKRKNLPAQENRRKEGEGGKGESRKIREEENPACKLSYEN